MLSAKTRGVFGKALQRFRKDGEIPAVVYGHGVESRALALSGQEFRRVYDKAGDSTLLNLTVDDQKSLRVLIHDIQRDPQTDQILHVDFYQVRMDEKIKAEIPFHFVGESDAVKAQGGTLVKNLDKIEVECLPGDLIHRIDVDISALKNFETTITIQDLHLPSGLEVLQPMDLVVTSVIPPRSEEELKALNEAVVEDVEKVAVAEKPKKEEEDATGESATGESSSIKSSS